MQISYQHLCHVIYILHDFRKFDYHKLRRRKITWITSNSWIGDEGGAQTIDEGGAQTLDEGGAQILDESRMQTQYKHRSLIWEAIEFNLGRRN